MLVIGEEGDELLALQLTSKDHDRDAEQELRDGRVWMDVGTGAWDSQRRAERGPAQPAAAPRPGRRTTRGRCRRPRTSSTPSSRPRGRTSTGLAQRLADPGVRDRAGGAELLGPEADAVLLEHPPHAAQVGTQRPVPRAARRRGAARPAAAARRGPSAHGRGRGRRAGRCGPASPAGSAGSPASRLRPPPRRSRVHEARELGAQVGHRRAAAPSRPGRAGPCPPDATRRAPAAPAAAPPRRGRAARAAPARPARRTRPRRGPGGVWSTSSPAAASTQSSTSARTFGYGDAASPSFAVLSRPSSRARDG